MSYRTLTTLKLQKELYIKFKLVASLHKMSMSSFVHKAMEMYIKDPTFRETVNSVPYNEVSHEVPEIPPDTFSEVTPPKEIAAPTPTIDRTLPPDPITPPEDVFVLKGDRNVELTQAEIDQLFGS